MFASWRSLLPSASVFTQMQFRFHINSTLGSLVFGLLSSYLGLFYMDPKNGLCFDKTEISIIYDIERVIVLCLTFSLFIPSLFFFKFVRRRRETAVVRGEYNGIYWDLYDRWTSHSIFAGIICLVIIYSPDSGSLVSPFEEAKITLAQNNLITYIMHSRVLTMMFDKISALVDNSASKAKTLNKNNQRIQLVCRGILVCACVVLVGARVNEKFRSKSFISIQQPFTL